MSAIQAKKIRSTTQPSPAGAANIIQSYIMPAGSRVRTSGPWTHSKGPVDKSARAPTGQITGSSALLGSFLTICLSFFTTNEPLKSIPYSKPFSQFTDANWQNLKSIHGPDGSSLANQYAKRAFLLAHDVPAISNPAGSDFVNDLVGSNMNTQLRSGNWGDWKHSDIKNQDLGRVWKLYSDMVSRGSLNKDLVPPLTN